MDIGQWDFLYPPQLVLASQLVLHLLAGTIEASKAVQQHKYHVL